MKQCSMCGNTKSQNNFYYGRRICLNCYSDAKKRYYIKNRLILLERARKKAFKKYHTHEGRKFFMYQRMRYIDKKSYHSPTFPSRKVFYSWVEKRTNFRHLFLMWKKNNWDTKIAPAVDRKDNSMGYFIKNMQIITKSENSIKRNKVDYPTVRALIEWLKNKSMWEQCKKELKINLTN